MAAARLTPFASAFKCPNCRASILETFAASVGPPFIPSRSLQISSLINQKRNLHGSPAPRDDRTRAPDSAGTNIKPFGALDALEASIGGEGGEQAQRKGGRRRPMRRRDDGQRHMRGRAMASESTADPDDPFHEFPPRRQDATERTPEIYETSGRQMVMEESASHAAATIEPPKLAEDEGQKTDDTQQPSTQLSNTPWYLQDQAQASDVNPFAERQRLPDIPEHSPPMLEPLLKHISIDLGLDYLSIVDLRSLDPPPAFGANLMMIFGSTRSEKHLNVSADRLCRWLRSTYNLRPHADGLLGRNELKLKLKRKNKRAKILTAAGGSFDPKAVDDGIATGWVCVNIGEVEGGILPGTPQDPTEKPGFVGFGTRARGAKIVVQMMTEAKRGEVDLEGLWQGTVDRAKKIDSAQQKTLERELREAEQEDAWEESLRQSSPFDLVPGTGSTQPSQYPREPSAFDALNESHRSSTRFQKPQARHYHTSARSLQAEVLRDTSLHDTNNVPPHKTQATQQSDLRTQTRYVDYLYSASASEAIEMLGLGENDVSSTPFLQSFHDARPLFRDAEDFLAGIDLQCHAVGLGHPGYSRSRILSLLEEMHATGLTIPESTFLFAFKTVLTVHNSVVNHHARAFSQARDMVTDSLTYGCRILKFMELHGYPVNSPEIMQQIHIAISFPQFAHENAHLIPKHLYPDTLSTYSAEQLTEAYGGTKDKSGALRGPRPGLSAKYRKTVQAFYDPLPSDDGEGHDGTLFKLMLRTYAYRADYKMFWDCWWMVPRMMLPRDEDMYVIMLQLVAAMPDGEILRASLMEHVPEMMNEEPPVSLTPRIAEALHECLVAGKTHRGMGEPWAMFWRWVDAVLGSKAPENDQRPVGLGVGSRDSAEEGA